MIDQRSVRINQGTKARSFLQKDHVTNPLVGRKEIGHARGHQTVDINRILVNDHVVKALRKTEVDQGAEVQEDQRVGVPPGEAGHGAEAREETKTDHEAEAQEEAITGHGVGVLKGKELEAEAQEKTGIDHKVPTKANKDGLHQKKRMLCRVKMRKKLLHHYQRDNLSL